MKVREIMRSEVASCPPEASLSEVARIMWESDCGLVPIVDEQDGAVAGVVTDRDVCMAAWTRGQPLHEIPVRVPMSTDLKVCHPDDDLIQAQKLMQENRVKRLLVLDEDQHLAGVVSLACLARAAQGGPKAQRDRFNKGVAEVLASFAKSGEQVRVASA